MVLIDEIGHHDSTAFRFRPHHRCPFLCPKCGLVFIRLKSGLMKQNGLCNFCRQTTDHSGEHPLLHRLEHSICSGSQAKPFCAEKFCSTQNLHVRDRQCMYLRTTLNPSSIIYFLAVSSDTFLRNPGSKVSFGSRSSLTHWQIGLQ